jgi:hypothetical protein
LINIQGTPKTIDKIAYTPTLTDNTGVITNVANYQMEGMNIVINSHLFMNGAGAGGALGLSIPKTIDTSRLVVVSNTYSNKGHGQWYNSGTGWETLNVAYSTTAQMRFYIGGNGALSSSALAAGDAVDTNEVKFPIVGWSNIPLIER